MAATIRPSECSGKAPVLYVALELSDKQWKLAFTVGVGQRPRLRGIAARAMTAFAREVAEAKRRFGLPAETPVLSCYEAGRDGFWIHRWLSAQGIRNSVVDSSSIEVPRRKRRAKTDRLDAEKLVALLLRATAGERHVWRVVQVPTADVEDARHWTRELDAWKSEQKRLMNRLRGLLITQGVAGSIRRNFATQLDLLRQADNGAPLGERLRARLTREWEHLEFVRQQMRSLQRKHETYLQQAQGDRSADVIRHLMRLAGIAETGASVLSLEMFGWRHFTNRREVGGFLGLTGTPYDSGERRCEQGISKAGNARLRALFIQLAWVWLRCQPTSALSQWYQRRFAASPHARRIGIVALARRLAIALWRYVEWGDVPEGAVLKPAVHVAGPVNA